MSRLTLLVILGVALISCSKNQDASGGATAGSGSATEPAAGSGSAAAAGSGSAEEGSAAAAGSGSAEEGSAEEGSAEEGSAKEGSGSATEAADGDGDGDGDGDEHEGGDSYFDKLSHDDQRKLMKTKVMPAMKAAFQAFDKKKFAHFTCKTCHGKDPKAVKYKMPNPELPKLDFAALKVGKQKPKTAKFMTEVVRPKMAEILHEPEASQQHPDGFACLDCHEAKK